MRHVSVAEFKDKMAQFMSAADGGEEIVITRHGRAYMRLVPMRDDDAASRRQALADLAAFREAQRAKGVPPTSREEIKAWINEGRR